MTDVYPVNIACVRCAHPWARASAAERKGEPMDSTITTVLPPVVDAARWRRQLDELRVREKAATRELDAIAAQRRRLPMVEMPDYVLQGADGPVRLADIFEGKH